MGTVGGKDGLLVVHDMRTNKKVFNKQLHCGAVNQVKTNPQGCIVTCSADKSLAIIDPQSGFKERGRMLCKDMVFCFENAFDCTAAGCGDGNLLVFDNNSMKCLYGFGAMKVGSISCMKVNKDCSKLVVCGEDPTS